MLKRIRIFIQNLKKYESMQFQGQFTLIVWCIKITNILIINLNFIDSFVQSKKK